MTVEAIAATTVSSASTANAGASGAAGASPGTGTPPGPADQDLAQQFHTHMSDSKAAPAGTVQMHQAHASHGLEAAITHVRTETAALDSKYETTMKQATHISEMMDPSDPMMTMVRLADFGYSTSLTLAQYQFSLSMADASNGLSHSLLKNQAE